MTALRLLSDILYQTFHYGVYNISFTLLIGQQLITVLENNNKGKV